MVYWIVFHKGTTNAIDLFSTQTLSHGHLLVNGIGTRHPAYHSNLLTNEEAMTVQERDNERHGNESWVEKNREGAEGEGDE